MTIDLARMPADRKRTSRSFRCPKAARKWVQRNRHRVINSVDRYGRTIVNYFQH